MKNKFFLFSFIIVLNINAKDIEKNYDELFYYLQNNNIILEEDVPMDKLFDMIESGRIFDEYGNINNEIINARISKLIAIKQKSFESIKLEISKNPNHLINKEVKNYLNNNQEIENKKKELEDKSDSWQTNIINYVLDLMKF